MYWSYWNFLSIEGVVYSEHHHFHPHVPTSTLLEAWDVLRSNPMLRRALPLPYPETFPLNAHLMGPRQTTAHLALLLTIVRKALTRGTVIRSCCNVFHDYRMLPIYCYPLTLQFLSRVENILESLKCIKSHRRTRFALYVASLPIGQECARLVLVFYFGDAILKACNFQCSEFSALITPYSRPTCTSALLKTRAFFFSGLAWSLDRQRAVGKINGRPERRSPHPFFALVRHAEIVKRFAV